MTDDQILKEAERAVKEGLLYINTTWRQNVDDVMQCVNSEPGQSAATPTPEAIQVRQMYDDMTRIIFTFGKDMEWAVQSGKLKHFLYPVFSRFSTRLFQLPVNLLLRTGFDKKSHCFELTSYTLF